jgi:hypothetical protein
VAQILEWIGTGITPAYWDTATQPHPEAALA